MKNLKLEVGKTYLTRHGENVKIVGDNGHEMFPFEGDNCLSYTLDGHWDFGRDSVFDLIAEAPVQPEKRTFKIPENTREISVNETDGRIVIEFVPEAPELTERERIRAFLYQRGWGGVSEDSISDIEAYIKHREAQQCKIKTTHIRVHDAGELFSEIAAKLTEEHAERGNGRVETDDFEMEGYTWSCVARIEAESKVTHYRDTPPEYEWTHIYVEIIEILCTDKDGDEVDATYFDEKGKEIGDDELEQMVENFLTEQ